jgi:hypothetical protein
VTFPAALSRTPGRLETDLNDVQFLTIVTPHPGRLTRGCCSVYTKVPQLIFTLLCSQTYQRGRGSDEKCADQWVSSCLPQRAFNCYVSPISRQTRTHSLQVSPDMYVKGRRKDIRSARALSKRRLYTSDRPANWTLVEHYLHPERRLPHFGSACLMATGKPIQSPTQIGCPSRHLKHMIRRSRRAKRTHRVSNNCC